MSELNLSLDDATLDILALKVAEHMASLTDPEVEDCWDSLRAARYLGYVVDTEEEKRKARKRMSEHVRAGRIVCDRDGERLLFRKSYLDNYLEHDERTNR